jgi:hypothetical protein
MNPSASGWVTKFGHILKEQKFVYFENMALFNQLKSLGFFYGSNVAIPAFIITEHEASIDERTKINLLFAMYCAYNHHCSEQNKTNNCEEKKNDFNEFSRLIIQYYKDLKVFKTSLFDGFLGEAKNDDLVAGIIDQRVFVVSNKIHKAFGNFSLNPYLTIDYLGFKRFLTDKDLHITAINQIEKLGYELVHKATTLFKREEAPLEIFEKSMLLKEYKSLKDNDFKFTQEELQYLTMISAVNGLPNKKDLNQFPIYLKFSEEILKVDIADIKSELVQLESFIESNKKHIPGRKTMAMGEQLYENLSFLVNKLILRNSKRLLKEIKGSQELVLLITKSTHSDLSALEKKKIQAQLLDIFKSIPSLAIFILPGGAILLPIFIKLIPKLLPSAFDDNRIP